jgi:hypothetical protein
MKEARRPSEAVERIYVVALKLSPSDPVCMDH